MKEPSLMLKTDAYFTRPKRREEDLYVATDYKIVYEDQYFMAIDKPSPLPVHPVGNFMEKNLLSILRKQKEYFGMEFWIVNRLDSETSGVMLVAKSKKAAARLSQQFEARTVRKEYQAIVFGALAEKSGVIDLALGVEITPEGYHLRTLDPAGETAETSYEVVREAGDYSLIKVTPLTGRTHQIRAHFAFIGHPIVGDKIYIDNAIYHQYVLGGWQEEMRESLKLDRLALHASSLTIRHPWTYEEMTFGTSIPDVFHNFLNGFSEAQNE